MEGFYVKEVSSKSVIDASSALPMSVKRTVMTQEILRILLNCSINLPWETLAKHVSNMTLRMQFSGYGKGFRHQVVKSALSAYETLLEKAHNGERPLYRPREWKREERDREKRTKAQRWYNKDYDSVLFIPATPNGELKKEVQQEISRSRVKIKVIERNGTPLTSLLQKSDPTKTKGCQREDCFVCTSGGKGDCTKNNIVYEIKCDDCGSKCVGESARNAYTRGKEHEKLLHEKEKSSPLWTHCMEKHGGNIQRFKMSVKKSFYNDAMLRQITEAVHIRKTPGDKCMNGKDEWSTTCIPHARIQRE